MHPYDPNSSDTDVCDSVHYCRVCDTEIDQSGYCETCDWAPASSTTKVVGDITYGLPYLTCQACQGKCDPTHRYVLQVDRIIDIVHTCNRAVIEICAGCYTKFPWNLNIEP